MQINPFLIAFLTFLVLSSPFILILFVKNFLPAIYYCKWNKQHNWAWRKTNNPCREESYCSYCGLRGKERTCHQWVWQKVEDTCLEVSFCEVCHQQGAERTLEHEWGDWEKVENECLERKRCTHCHEIGEERIAHTWGDWERIEGTTLERKVCIYCKELCAERKADLKSYCENCNGTGLVTLGGWNVATTCSVCGGSGVIKKYFERTGFDEEND